MSTNLVFEKPSDYGVIDYDGLWKKLIYELFEEFVLFFVPNLHEEIDFQKEPEFLQQELFQEIIREKKGKQIADQIVKVFLKSGDEKWILIHIEVQGDPDSDFSKRMFRYYYRIFDKFDQGVVAVALLTDASKAFRPDTYHQSFHGTSLTYKYNTYKFHDQKENELLQSTNPFAIAVLAAKYANDAKNETEKRYRFKRKLFRLILEKNNYPSPQQRIIYISTLIYFIDYLLQIPLELTQKLRNEIIRTKEGRNMMYMNRNSIPKSWAELEEIFKEEGREKGKAEGKTEGKEEGIREGKEEEKRAVAIEMLKDGMAIELVSKYVKLPLEEVNKLAERE